MTNAHRVLIIGIDPDAIDYSLPGTPPGATAEFVKAGLAATRDQFGQQGVHLDLCMIQPDDTAEATIVAQLALAKYDCVVIGGGIRLPEPNLVLFETVLNAVHRHAPQAAIAFNTRPHDSFESAARWLRRN